MLWDIHIRPLLSVGHTNSWCGRGPIKDLQYASVYRDIRCQMPPRCQISDAPQMLHVPCYMRALSEASSRT